MDAFVEEADYEKGFGAYYDANVAPLAARLEGKRRKHLLLFGLLCAMGPVLVVAILFVPFERYERYLQYVVVFLMLLLGLGPFFAQKLYQRYAAIAKETILPPVLAFYGLKYTRAGMSGTTLARYDRVLPRYTSSVTSDRVSGSLDGVAFTTAQLTLFFHYNFETVSRTRFSGVAMMFPMNQTLGAETSVYSKAARSLERGTPVAELVELESPTGNATFRYRSTDPAEARSLLTPPVMERMAELGRLMGNWGRSRPAGKSTPEDFRCAMAGHFTDASLLLLIATKRKPLTMGNLFVPASTTASVHTVLYQISLIRRLIEALRIGPESAH